MVYTINHEPFLLSYPIVTLEDIKEDRENNYRSSKNMIGSGNANNKKKHHRKMQQLSRKANRKKR